VAITPAGAPALGQLDGDRAHTARARVHDHGLTGLQVRAGAQQVPGRGALHEGRQRGRIGHCIGHFEQHPGVGGRLLGVPAPGQQADQPPPVVGADDDLAARDERQALPAEVRVLGLVGVGVVDARGQDVEHLLAVTGNRVGQFADDQGLGSAELGDLYRAHAPDRTRR
jgi:hypothetical protein